MDVLLVRSEPTMPSVFALPARSDSSRICRRQLIRNTGVVAGASLVTFGILYMLPEDVTNWDKDELTAGTAGEQWWENVSSGPVWDDDDWFFNYVGHPYCGGIFYMGARGAGYKVIPSFLYTTAMSTVFWEYGIEAFAEVPSVQDLILTPIAGAAVGECFFSLNKYIRNNDNRLFGKKWAGHIAMWLTNPLNSFTDLLNGKSCAQPYAFSGQLVPSGKGVQFQAAFTWKL